MARTPTRRKHFVVFELILNPNTQSYYWRNAAELRSREFGCLADAFMAMADYEIDKETMVYTEFVKVEKDTQ